MSLTIIHGKAMRALLVLTLVMLPARVAFSQATRGVRVVAYIVSIHADSSGRALQGRRSLDSASLQGMLDSVRQRPGGTIWFSWSGGPAHPRTRAQEALLARLRASGVRVELRSDSTLRSRVVRP